MRAETTKPTSETGDIPAAFHPPRGSRLWPPWQSEAPGGRAGGRGHSVTAAGHPPSTATKMPHAAQAAQWHRRQLTSPGMHFCTQSALQLTCIRISGSAKHLQAAGQRGSTQHGRVSSSSASLTRHHQVLSMMRREAISLKHIFQGPHQLHMSTHQPG